MDKNILREKSGFTMIEMLVAIGIFSVVLVIASGGFVRSVRTEKQASAFVAVNDNLSTVLEQMAREMRTGTSFCGGVACSPSSALTFINATGNTITYCLQTNAIERVAGSGCAAGNEITGSNVFIQYLTFIVSGNLNNDGWPPKITILVGANPKDQSASNYSVNLQTTVSSRVIGG